MHRSFVSNGLAGLALTALFAFTSFAFTSQGAQAAPQALALVETNGPVGLTCTGGTCSAELTAFCLQSDRVSPVRGTRYHLAQADQVQVVGTTRDGRAVSLDPQQVLRFDSARSHLAVRVTVSQERLEELGLSRIAIAVGENAALLPEPVPGDPRPITESDVAVLTGPLRSLGARIVDGNEGRMEAARMTNRMINLLPPEPSGGAAFGDGLWRQAMTGTGSGDLSLRAKKLARGAFEFCRFVLDRGASSSPRRCLQKQHDGFINFLNSKYWEAVETGS